MQDQFQYGARSYHMAKAHCTDFVLSCSRVKMMMMTKGQYNMSGASTSQVQVTLITLHSLYRNGHKFKISGFV